MANFLRYLSAAMADAAFAIGMGLKGSIRPAVLFRSAAINIGATLLTYWLFRYQWDIAWNFVFAFTPLLVIGVHAAELSTRMSASAAHTTTVSTFNPIHGIADIVDGLGAAAHIVVAFAVCVVCAVILCGALLSLAGILQWLLPRVRERALAKTPGLQPLPEPPAKAWWVWPTRFAVNLCVFLALSQLVFFAAMLLPHLGAIWLLMLAYLPAAFLAWRSLRVVAQRKEWKAVIRQCRLPLLLLGVLSIVLALVPLVSFLAPAVLSIGATRLAYRTLAAQREYQPAAAMQVAEA